MNARNPSGIISEWGFEVKVEGGGTNRDDAGARKSVKPHRKTLRNESATEQGSQMSPDQGLFKRGRGPRPCRTNTLERKTSTVIASEGSVYFNVNIKAKGNIKWEG